MKYNVFAIIPAAGASLRFGNENKLLHKIDGKPIIQHVIDAVIISNVFAAVIVCGCYNIDKENFKLSNKINWTYNNNWQNGMGSSLSTGMLYLIENFEIKKNDGILILNADMPFVTFKTINKVIDSFFKSDRLITVPVFKNIKGHPVIFNSIFINEILNLNKDTGGINILKKNNKQINYVEVMSSEIINDIDFS